MKHSPNYTEKQGSDIGKSLKRRDIDGEEGRKDIDWTKGGRKE